ncbi:tetratricopeptide repeat protein [Xanthobacteraceae bacterium A53D]
MDKARETVFSSENLRIVHVPGAGDGPVFVTFAALDEAPPEPRPGFGEDFLAKHGFEAFHVLPAGNDWYQYPEMPEALARIRARVGPGRPLITYGSSMGGYAAFRFSGLLQAGRVICVSPQYSIDPALIPWERRWRIYSARIRPLWDTLEPNRKAEAFVFHDPRIDGRHARAIGRAMPVLPVRLPFSDHPCFPMLQELKLLTPAILAIAAGHFHPAALEREAHARRMDSPSYLANRALAPRWTTRRQRLALAERAARLAPHDPACLVALARVLAAGGQMAGAEAAYREAMALRPGEAGLLYAYRRFLAKAGRWTEAEAVVEEVMALHPGKLSRTQEIGALRAARAYAERPALVRGLLRLLGRHSLDGV